jgi:hypothetical protein
MGKIFYLSRWKYDQYGKENDMSRYIDADALIEALQADFDREGAKADDMAMRGLADVSVKYSHGQFCFLNAIEQVKITPTADVVPKSEVEATVEKLMSATDKVICEAKAEVAREIFGEIESMIIRYTFEDGYGEYISTGLKDEFDELKKKYTEGKYEN